MKTVEDVLKTNGHILRYVTPNSSINNAVKQMAEEQVGALPVLEAGKLVGVIYEKDCITKFVLTGRSMDHTQVKEVMSWDKTTANPDQTIEECLDLMTEKHMQYIPVTADSSFLGFVSISDLYRTFVDDQKDELYRLDNYILGIDFGK
jgi:CBS domain-containing protein